VPNIDITPLDNTGSNQSANSDLKIGAFARISSPIIDLVNNVEAARKSDDRLKAMQGMAAVANGYQAASAIGAMAGGAGSGTLIKGEVGIGFASSSDANNSNGSTAQGSAINGGGNVNLTASAGDLHATGATLGAGKTLTLDAARNIVLDASQSTYHADGKNSSAGVEVGVGYSVGAQTGVYAYVAANVGQGHSNSDGTTNNNTQLKADTINIGSKGDTTLKGAVATANAVNVDVGGKLAIESVQDTSKQESSQTNVGGRVQVSFGTAWDASGSLSQSKGSGSSTAVAEQSGLFAGAGGYHVKADTVDLKGSAIASTSAENSALATNKLTATNLANEMNYSASSVSLAGGIGGGSGKGDTNADGSAKAAGQQQLFGDRKSGNVTPGLPTVEKGGDRSTTYATVTDGKITIGGVTTGSIKDLGINTDASKANTALDKLPELQAVLKEQQAMSAAAGTVVATSKQVAGDIVANAVKTQAAAQQVLNDPNSTAEQKATAKTTLADAQKTAADWGKGGIYSRALDAGTTILVGGLTGQAGTQIAANAVAPTVAKTVGDIGSALANEAHSNELKYKALAEQATRDNDPVAAADYTAKANAAATTAANWGDNGIYRVGLHTSTQGLLGDLADGRTGALQSAAGVVGGNLGQQLGEKLGNAQADKLGLPPGAAREAFVNAYQQTGAVVGGLVAGATAAGATGANVDALLAAARGGSVASTVDLNNRQLHQTEKARIHELAKNDAKLEARLLIASCALIKCSAEFAIGSREYVEVKALEDIGSSDTFKAERDLLSQQVGSRGVRLFAYDSVNYLGGDVGIDALKRWDNTNGITTRLVGAGQVVGGWVRGCWSWLFRRRLER
jgi:filamentous hemagglutinin